LGFHRVVTIAILSAISV